MLKSTIEDEIDCIEYIKKLVIRGKISIKDINTSVRRIIDLKEKYALTNAPSYGTNVDNANRLIEEINKI